MTPKARVTHAERRRHLRSPVCARAELLMRDAVSEHVVYDLSLGGMRLCGTPRGRVGDELCVLLHLPSASAVLPGRLARVPADGARADFAVRFTHVDAEAETAIEDVLAEAVDRAVNPSILALESPSPSDPGPDWLAPVEPACIRVHDASDLIECVMHHSVELGVLRGTATDPPDWAWSIIHPGRIWRTMDPLGRLHVPADYERR